MKLILWVNFDVTGNQYEQKSILSHSDDGTFKTLQKYFECCKKIQENVDNVMLNINSKSFIDFYNQQYV